MQDDPILTSREEAGVPTGVKSSINLGSSSTQLLPATNKIAKLQSEIIAPGDQSLESSPQMIIKEGGAAVSTAGDEVRLIPSQDEVSSINKAEVSPHKEDHEFFSFQAEPPFKDSKNVAQLSLVSPKLVMKSPTQRGFTVVDKGDEVKERRQYQSANPRVIRVELFDKALVNYPEVRSKAFINHYSRKRMMTRELSRLKEQVKTLAQGSRDANDLIQASERVSNSKTQHTFSFNATQQAKRKTGAPESAYLQIIERNIKRLGESAPMNSACQRYSKINRSVRTHKNALRHRKPESMNYRDVDIGYKEPYTFLI